MALAKLSDIRRKELRQAAFAVLQREGIAGATLEKVAIEAGCSKGIVLHYFANKNALFEEVMREANLDLGRLVAERMRLAKSPQERLEAIIKANFEPRFFRPSVCHAWLSFCAEVPREPTLARIQRAIHSRMHSNLLSCLKHMLDRRDAEVVALNVSAIIDGLWLRLGLDASSVTPEGAVAQVMDYLESRLPGRSEASDR